MNIKANISISRDSNDEVQLRVEDEASRSVFLEMTFTPADFMRAITGLGHTNAQTTVVKNLSVVGKQKISETRKAIYPGDLYDSKEKMSQWLKSSCVEEGWEIDPYLGSQSSVSRSGSETALNYSVYRYEVLDADQSA